MQKDLLAELHLPKLDLKTLQTIVTKNSARLAYLINENKESLNKCKLIPLSKVVGSGVPDFSSINNPAFIRKEDIKTVKKKFFLKKSSIFNDDNHTNEVNPLCFSTTGDSTVAFNTKQLSNAENDSHFSERSLPDTKTSANEAFSESNNRTETESSNNVIGSSKSEEETEVQFPFSKFSGCIPFPIGTGVSILKKRNNDYSNVGTSEVESVPVKEVVSESEPGCEADRYSEPAFCVISEVIGNAKTAFGEADVTEENAKEMPEIQIITPKKTNDITKIKGWRRKQFFVEKPTTIEFFSVAKGSLSLNKKGNLSERNDENGANFEEPGNVENAFVCDSLNDFLDREAELKIGYEIPHLFAEVGIKLTLDEVVSKPNLSDKDLKEVESRYCVPVSLPTDTVNLDDIKEDITKGVKRPTEDDTNHCKIIKLDENKRQPIRSAQKLMKLKKESEVNFPESNSSSDEREKVDSHLKIIKQSDRNFNNVKLVSKLIAVVVYPGPSMPLHPFVQYHLDKIRSYRTKVDENWADFAASAVLVNERQYKRKVLPAYCCAKIEKKSSVNINNNIEEIGHGVLDEVKRVSVSPKTKNKVDDTNGREKPIKLKKCSVVLEKLNLPDNHAPWCMEHNCYNCISCGLGRPKHKSPGPHKKSKETVVGNEDLMESVIVSPRASFDMKIANLLVKKVRLLKINGDTLKTIDCLKTLTANTVEFIKLNFVKESFLSGYLNIWYLEAEVSGTRSRAFLSFSHTPPVPNAINLKSSAFSLSNLPKVITEIVCTENTLDSNEYAILHCDGKNWEIHGSLNIAFGKNDKSVEQIFTSSELPELKPLQEVAFEILDVKAVKWWVLDTTQKFDNIEVKFGSASVMVTRKKVLEAIKSNSIEFLPLKKTPHGRVLGAFLMKRLLPFVLIGPYYLLESNDLVLKHETSTVPFSYYGEENVPANNPLKFFINSVIINIKKGDKKLEGLWLYDKMCIDSTSYLEVVTKSFDVPPPKKYSYIDIEHGYSLSSLITSSLCGTNSGISKSRKNGKEEFTKITVYLYFNIFQLGFVEGELQFDNSVIISHPLDKRTKIKSHKVGDWFLGIVKRRIEFIPKDLPVRWFITRHKEDLRGRLPFNKFYLGGAHILTKYGVHYLLEISDGILEKIGIDRQEIVKAISQSEVINEVKELKSLSNVLVNDPSKSLSMYEVLTKAVIEIKNLRKTQKNLLREKLAAEKRRLNLFCCLIKKLNRCSISFHLKIKVIEKLEPMFRNNRGNVSEGFIKILRSRRIGRIYLKRKEGIIAKIKATEENRREALLPVKEKTKHTAAAKPGVVFYSVTTIPERKKCIPTILKLSKNIPSKTDPPKFSDIRKLPPGHNQYSSCDSIYSVSSKEPLGENLNQEQIRVEKSAEDLVPKNNKFLKRPSPDLPDNVKIYCKNWNIKKLENV